MKQAITIYLILIIAVTFALQSDAKRGCNLYGHSCYGGHGKRSTGMEIFPPRAAKATIYDKMAPISSSSSSSEFILDLDDELFQNDISSIPSSPLLSASKSGSLSSFRSNNGMKNLNNPYSRYHLLKIIQQMIENNHLVQRHNNNNNNNDNNDNYLHNIN